MRFWRILSVVVLAFVLVPRADAADGTVVRDYQATYDVAEDGSATVVETMRVRLPGPDRGIEREFDASDPNWTPRDLRVTQDGEPAEIVQSRSGGVLKVRVGDDVDGAGVRTYRFTYTFDNVFESLDDAPGSVVMHWYAVSPNWQTRMNRTSIKVVLPAAAGDIQCTVGESKACEVTDEADGFSISTDRLAPKTPIVIRAELDLEPTPTPEPTETPEPSETPTPTPTPTEEPSETPTAGANDPDDVDIAPDGDDDEGDEDSGGNGTAIATVAILLTLLIGALLLWLLARRSKDDEEKDGSAAEEVGTLSFLESDDEVVDGEIVEDAEEVGPDEDGVEDTDDAADDEVIDGEILNDSEDGAPEDKDS